MQKVYMKSNIKLPSSIVIITKKMDLETGRESVAAMVQLGGNFFLVFFFSVFFILKNSKIIFWIIAPYYIAKWPVSRFNLFVMVGSLLEKGWVHVHNRCCFSMFQNVAREHNKSTLFLVVVVY